MASRRGRLRADWWMSFMVLCLFLTVVTSQTHDFGDTSSIDAGTGSSDTTAPMTLAPGTTAPTTTAPATTAPATTSPTPTTAAPSTRAPTTSAPILPTTAPRDPTTTAPASATTAPTSPTAAPVATTAPSTTTATSSPATPTAAPVVEYYNSSTLPPGVDASMLGGAELVTVEVTETTMGDGTTSYSYVIITRSGDTEKTIVLSPTSSSATSSSGDSNTATQSGSSLADSNNSNATKSSSSIGPGAIVGIIVAAVVFMLVLFAFFIAQRRRNKHRRSDASSEDFLASPTIGKQSRLLELGQSPADTEYQEITRTAANSRSSGGSMPDGRRHRNTLWEDPVILASRIPIDRIELGAIVSRGGFGEVYRGRYRDQDVAIKTLLPEKRKDLAHIQAFLSEVRLMATMEHPHIVQFIGVAWESLSNLFCVTEFMVGGDLRSLLKDYLSNGVPQGMDACKMQIAYQVAYALTYLHSLDPVVLHRDLKSRNILLTESLNAKITDFGASRIRSDATMTAGVGSCLWMAPEVMMGKRYGEKADVFSLGVVISELDTHELPYSHAKEGNSGGSGHPLPDTAVLQMVSMGKLRVRFSPFMDPDMARFVGSCVNVDPEARPTAAEVLYYMQVALREF